MGSFIVFYTQLEGVILNLIVSITAIIVIFISFIKIANNVGIKVQKVTKRAMIIFGVQVCAAVAATIISVLIAVLMDLVHMPMSWFTHLWLILGLYICPLFFGMGIIPALYFTKTPNVGKSI